MSEFNLAEYIGTKIKYYRNELGWTQDDLAKKLNTTKATISNYETGYRSPKQDSLFDLAKTLNISIDDLFPPTAKQLSSIETIYNKLEPSRQKIVYNCAEKQLEEQNSSNIIDFPQKSDNELSDFDWRGYVSAGTGEYLDGVTSETIDLTEDQIPDGADFALTVNGDSMKPMFKDHDLIFVEETPDLQNGSIGIVIVNDEAYLKKVYYNDFGMTLVSLNQEYEDIELTSTDEIKVIGKVVM